MNAMQVGGARSGWCCWLCGQQGGGLGQPARLAGKASRKVSIAAAAALPPTQQTAVPAAHWLDALLIC
jgi:hypothetical protein